MLPLVSSTFLSYKLSRRSPQLNGYFGFHRFESPIPRRCERLSCRLQALTHFVRILHILMIPLPILTVGTFDTSNKNVLVVARWRLIYYLPKTWRTQTLSRLKLCDWPMPCVTGHHSLNGNDNDNDWCKTICLNPGLNGGPIHLQCSALPTELLRHTKCMPKVAFMFLLSMALNYTVVRIKAVSPPLRPAWVLTF